MNAIPSTWALMQIDLEEKKPFSRWKDPDNEIHNLQWQLTELAMDAVKNSDKSAPGFAKTRTELDKALHSDQYWWASARPWWSIEMIECGANELYKTVLSAPGISEEKKQKAFNLYQAIIFKAFDWQRSGLVDELAKREDEDIRQRTDEGFPRLPKEEIEKMTGQLKSELESVVKQQEFERAAQIRDRIKELQSYSAGVEKPFFEGENPYLP